MHKQSKNYYLLFSLLSCSFIYSDERPSVIIVNKENPTTTNQSKKNQVVFQKEPTPLTKTKKSSDKKIWFKFKDEPLLDIVNYVANAAGKNIVLPTDQDALNLKTTFQFPEKISIEQAYNKTLTMLKITGYSIVPQNDFYYIVKNDPNLFKNPFPLYINTAPEDLPDTDEVIRYMYYFANIQVPSGGNSSFGGATGSNALQMLLKDTLSNTATVMYENSINGMVITDYARNIRAIMEVVIELDAHGFTDMIEIVPLKYTNATTIATLFKTLISQSTDSASQTGGNFGFPSAPIQAPSSSAQYFAQTTRIVPDVRTNSLIIMGKKNALKRVREFLQKYIDVPLDEGESILHIYPLQYLNAQSFTPILQQIISNSNGSSSVGGGMYGGSTGQSSGTLNNSPGKQYFKGVIIAPEIATSSNNANTNAFTNASGPSGAANASPPQPPQQGGNRLIIAATREDWIRLKKLISDLDRPQPQVAIEVLIVDLTLTGAKALGSQVRNKEGMFPTGVNAQNSTLGPIQFGGPTISSTAFDALMANLLQLDSTGQSNMASNMSQGSFVLSVEDNATTGIAWVLQALNSYNNAQILSHPFCVTLNNQPTSFTDQATRLLPGAATVKKGATFAPITPTPAALSVSITPTINGENFINLGININISEFADLNSQINRIIQTNANVKNGQVLVLGGLTKTVTNTTTMGTPGFDQIPIVGWLFKKKTKGVIKSNLAVFLCPCILESTNGRVDPFTSNKFLAAHGAINSDNNLSNLKDPITRWFFGATQENSKEKIQNFIDSKPFMNKKDYANLKVSENRKASGKKLYLPQTEVKESKQEDISEEEIKEVQQVASVTSMQPDYAQEPEELKIEKPHTKVALDSEQKTESTNPFSEIKKSEEEELKQLFAQFDGRPKHDLKDQKQANLL